MQLVQLANFVLDNLLQSRVGFIVIFHCWPRDESGGKPALPISHFLIFPSRPGLQFALQLVNPLHPNLAYHQYVPMRGVQDWSHLELSYLAHLQPTLAIYVDLRCHQAQDLLEEVGWRFG